MDELKRRLRNSRRLRRSLGARSAPIRCWCRRRAATPRSSRTASLWIKASGTWLTHARERDIMVPVRARPAARSRRTRDDPAGEKAAGFRHRGTQSRAACSPSIETTVHALMPQTRGRPCPLRRDHRLRRAGRCRRRHRRADARGHSLEPSCPMRGRACRWRKALPSGCGRRSTS